MQISTLISRSARYFKDQICLTEGNRDVSFNEFDRLTNAVGNALIASGLEPGDRVGVLLPNSIDCLVAYYALAKAGLVRVGMNTRETVANHHYKLEDSGARAVIHCQSSGFPVEININEADFTLMLTHSDDGCCSIDRSLDAPLRLGYTGGTTGQAKAVTLTTRGELAEMSAFLMDLVPDLEPQSSFLHAAPIAHASGAFFLPALVRGVRSIVMKKFDPAAFIVLAQDSQATHTFLVPTMLAMILEEPSLDDAQLAFKKISYGASPIAPSLLERSEKQFGRIFAQCYGQAESPMVITFLAPEDHDRVGACGRPFSFVDCAVFDENDLPLGDGEIGEIVCRGPQTMAYYWNRAEATEKVFRNGWLHTGDLGYRDEDGFYYLVDRKNDMLISGGYNVYPREVEDVLMAYDGVLEAAVVGLPDEKWGDRIHAAVAVRDPETFDLDALLSYAKANLANYKKPKSIEVWEDLPKSAANKILRRLVKERLMES